VVHEVDEAFLLGEPGRVLLVLGLVEVDRLRVGEALGASEVDLVAERGGFGSAGATAFDFAVDDAEEVQGLLHHYKIISQLHIPYLLSRISI
jgi:hypothetical protein